MQGLVNSAALAGSLVGSLFLGRLADRIGRRAIFQYAILWYAAFTALELDVLGPRPHAAGTAYSLLGASGNLPIAYMTWLDGVGYKHSGARGLMTVDLLANGIGGVLLLLFGIYYARTRLQNASTP